MAASSSARSMRRSAMRPKRRDTSAIAAGTVAPETQTSTAWPVSSPERASTPKSRAKA